MKKYAPVLFVAVIVVWIISVGMARKVGYNAGKAEVSKGIQITSEDGTVFSVNAYQAYYIGLGQATEMLLPEGVGSMSEDAKKKNFKEMLVTLKGTDAQTKYSYADRMVSALWFHCTECRAALNGL